MNEHVGYCKFPNQYLGMVQRNQRNPGRHEMDNSGYNKPCHHQWIWWRGSYDDMEIKRKDGQKNIREELYKQTHKCSIILNYFSRSVSRGFPGRLRSPAVNFQIFRDFFNRKGLTKRRNFSESFYVNEGLVRNVVKSINSKLKATAIPLMN